MCFILLSEIQIAQVFKSFVILRKKIGQKKNKTKKKQLFQKTTKVYASATFLRKLVHVMPGCNVHFLNYQHHVPTKTTSEYSPPI